MLACLGRNFFFEVLILQAGPTNLPKCLSFRFCLTCISQLLCVTVRFMLANWMTKPWYPFDEFNDFCILAGTNILTQVAMNSPFLCNVHENPIPIRRLHKHATSTIIFTVSHFGGPRGRKTINLSKFRLNLCYGVYFLVCLNEIWFHES